MAPWLLAGLIGLLPASGLFIGALVGYTERLPHRLIATRSLTHRHPEECLFIGDRAVNVEYADQMGIPTIQFHDPDHLKDDLERRGVAV